jgi:hypothetical protein
MHSVWTCLCVGECRHVYVVWRADVSSLFCEGKEMCGPMHIPLQSCMFLL